MESQILVGHRGYGALVLPQTGSATLTFQPSSLGKHQQQLWRFCVPRRLALSPPCRKRNAVEVRAEKPGGTGLKVPGTSKSKKVEEIADDAGQAVAAVAEEGTQKLPKPPGPAKSLSGPAKLPTKQKSRRKNSGVVFVAGSTGNVGRRVVKELYQLGYTVRAGVRNADKAEFLVEFATGAEKPDKTEEGEVVEQKAPNFWSNFAPEKIFGFLGPAKKEPGVELVEFDLEKPETIEEAIGGADFVVCAIGANPSKLFDATAPYRIDFKATESLINAASTANVKHFVLVTSMGTNKVGWPAAALNLFWGVLAWKRKAEEALIASGIPFTIVRPGGMERPTDTFKETHNLLLAPADTRFGGLVSNLQVAELIGGVISNLELAQNKILEAVAEETAALRDIEDLLAEIPSVSDTEALQAASLEEKLANEQELRARKQRDAEEKEANREELKAAKQREEEEKAAKLEEARAAKQREEEERRAAQERQEAEEAKERAKTEALRQKLQSQFEGAREREEAARLEAEKARLEKEEIERKVAEVRSKIEAAAQAAREAKALEVAVTAAARDGKTLSDREKRDVVVGERNKIKAELKQKEQEEKARLKEEKEKRDAEAKAKAAAEKEKAAKEKEAAKAEAEKKRKAEEADRVAKAEAEKKKKESEKAEADKKAKAEEDKKAKAKAEEDKKAKAKAEEEQRAKAEAEKKAKAEEEKKAKAEADKKAKEEEEKKAKAEAEQKATKAAEEKKAKAEEEKRVKADAEAKAKSEAEEKKQRSEAEKKIKPKAETKVDKEVDKAKAGAEEGAAKVVGVVASGDVFDEKKRSELQDTGVKGAEEAAEKLKALAAQAKAEAKAREEEAVQKAKYSGATFLWPWQKEDGPYSPKATVKETTASLPTPTDELPPTDRPLSPFAQYSDLKPPSSPEPSPPTPQTPKAEKEDKDEPPQDNGSTDTKSEKSFPAPPPPSPPTPPPPIAKAGEEIKKASPPPLIAKAGEEIKKASPPLPIAKAGEEIKKALTVSASQLTAEAVSREQDALEKAKAATAFNFSWPWQKSDGDGPSGSPTSSTTASPQSSSTTDLPRTSRPLSPYWRYPDLKPPTSPSPSQPTRK